MDTRRWYHHCNTLGFLVWQDIPAWSGNEDGFDGILGPEIEQVRNIYTGLDLPVLLRLLK